MHRHTTTPRRVIDEYSENRPLGGFKKPTLGPMQTGGRPQWESGEVMLLSLRSLITLRNRKTSEKPDGTQLKFTEIQKGDPKSRPGIPIEDPYVSPLERSKEAFSNLAPRPSKFSQSTCALLCPLIEEKRLPMLRCGNACY